jgi:chemotaxis protein methyltransferase WspC
MSLENIKNYLLEQIGLDPESIGDSSIERAIIHRMDALETEKYEDYFTTIKENKDEFEELVEEVVVPETWFFRNTIPFDALVQCINRIRENENGSERVLKILSVPCSTGEEPYSIAITLLKNGIKEGSFHIDAVDISRKALIKAKRAIYGKHSFRETNGFIDEKYFQQTRAGYQITPEVKKHISFIKANLLKDNISPSPEYYDAIFCRNLLIYFNRNTQKNVLTKLNILMRPEGVLFVGHAETACVNKEYFSSINIPRTFAYRKNISAIHGNSDNMAHKSEDNLRLIYDKLVEVTKKDIELAKIRKEKFSRILKSSVVRKTSDDKPGWWEIEKLIEQGNLVDASFLCEKKISEIPEDAQGYYYLGLVCSLEGNVSAADSLLKKAVYLDPNHHKALGLLALLAEQRGENNVAESLRFRELRAKKRTH